MSCQESFAIDKLNEKLADETLCPEQREKARSMRDQFQRVYEKRAVMDECPALCLMELARATAAGSDRAVEPALRYTPRRFWYREAFCREAIRINPDEAWDRAGRKIAAALKEEAHGQRN
jgi:hypothetical protein